MCVWIHFFCQFPVKMALSSPAACSLFLYCGVNSKWVTTIKHKMKFEWHYLKIYLKPWQVSVCSNRSILNTRRIKKLWLFCGRISFSVKSDGKTTHLFCITRTAMWISKQGSQYKYTINYAWTGNLIVCITPLLYQLLFSHLYTDTRVT